MTDTLTTERLTLRRPVADDAAWLAAEIARPEVHKWLISPPRPYHLADAKAWLGFEDTQRHAFVICREDTPLGCIGSPGDTGGELGFWLRVDAWGQGYMTEAARAVVAMHFAHSDAPIPSGYIVGNAGSWNVQTKLGFVHTEIEVMHSNFHDAEVENQRTTLTHAAWHAKSA